MTKESIFGHFDISLPVPPRRGPSFTAGGSIKGAFATGDFAMATASFTETMPPDRSVDIAASLAALRAQLAQIHGLDPKAVTRVAEAQEEAKKPTPDRIEISNLIGQATRYATKTAGFAEAVEHLAPHLKQVWNWTGTALPDWAASLGMR